MIYFCQILSLNVYHKVIRNIIIAGSASRSLIGRINPSLATRICVEVWHVVTRQRPFNFYHEVLAMEQRARKL